MSLLGHARTAAALARPGHVSRATASWLRDRRGRRGYRVLGEDELLETRGSDTAFVFGSGRSLAEIEDAEWGRIARHDTVSLREFPRQQWVRASYHLTGEIDFIDEYAARLRANPLYSDTVFVVQEGWRAEMGNELVGRRLLPADARLFRFKRVARGRYSPPSRRFGDGVVHGYNSIIGATNFAVLMGWRRIVLTGVDLYNKEYFWLPAGETRMYEKPGLTATSLFQNHAEMIDMLGRWSDLLAPEGIRILVHNPRSLLAQRLGVFSWDA